MLGDAVEVMDRDGSPQLAAALQQDEDEQMIDNNPSKDNAASAPPHREKLSATKAAKKPTKYKKNPNAPKRFRSAFIIYSKDKHKEIRLQLESMGIEENTMNIARLVSDKWREMVPQERESWEERARQDKARYINEKAHYEGPWKVPANKRKPKDPTSPKKPVPAYFAFSNARRQLIKNENTTATNAEISRILAKMWKEAPDEVKNVYLEEEAGRREEHAVAMEEWRRENKKHQEEEEAQAAEEAARNPTPAREVSVSADGSSSDNALSKNRNNNLENQARNSDSANESSSSNNNHESQVSYNMPINFQQSQQGRQLSFGTGAAGSMGIQGSLQQPFINSSQQQFNMNPAGSRQHPPQQHQNQQIPDNLFASTAAALAAVNGNPSAAAALLAATNPGLGSALLNTNILGGLAPGLSSLSNGRQGLSLSNGQSFSLSNNGQQGVAISQQQQQQPAQVQQQPPQQQQQEFNALQAIPPEALLQALLGGQLGIQLGDQGGGGAVGQQLGQQLSQQLGQQLLQQLLQQLQQQQQQQPNQQLAQQLNQQFGQTQQLNQQLGQRQLNQQEPQQQQQQYGQQQQHNQQQQLGQQLNQPLGQQLSQQFNQQLSQVLFGEQNGQDRQGDSQDQRRGSGN